jgi:hypothetical protein
MDCAFIAQVFSYPRYSLHIKTEIFIMFRRNKIVQKKTAGVVLPVDFFVAEKLNHIGQILEMLVRVKRHKPHTSALFKSEVAGGGKVVNPVKVKDFICEAFSNFNSSVG